MHFLEKKYNSLKRISIETASCCLMIIFINKWYNILIYYLKLILFLLIIINNNTIATNRVHRSKIPSLIYNLTLGDFWEGIMVKNSSTWPTNSQSENSSIGDWIICASRKPMRASLVFLPIHPLKQIPKCKTTFTLYDWQLIDSSEREWRNCNIASI